jgi:hypothetical protein
MKLKCFILMFLFMLMNVGISVAEEKAADTPPKTTETPATDNTPVAKCDGFVITKNEVKEFQDLVEQGTQRTTEREYVKYTFLLRLFAEEAKAFGLDKEKPEDISTLTGRMKLSEMQMAKLANSYVVKDEVIESYYLAHPDMYKTDSGVIKPLDDSIRKEIREKVLVIKKSSIQNAELERLKQKYHMRVCEGGECK